MTRRLILPALRGYRASWLGPDVLAGLTLAAIAVPEQMATARLANMPAVAGLYAFLAGSVLFAVLGRSRQVSVGADSTITPVLAAGVATVAVSGTPRFTHLVSFFALMVGAMLIAVGLLRLGWISEFLSTPVVTGVLAGIAVQIVVRQLPAILGLAGGGTTTVGRIREVIVQIGRASGWSVGIAVAVFTVVVAAEHLDRRIPGALIGLVASILVVDGLGLASRVAEVRAEGGGYPAGCAGVVVGERVAVEGLEVRDLGRAGGLALGAHDPLDRGQHALAGLLRVAACIELQHGVVEEAITLNNVTVRVDAVVYCRMIDPFKAIINVQNYDYAVSQAAQISLRSVIGQNDLDQLLSGREKINAHLKDVIDAPTKESWGIRVERVELKDISLPGSMKRSMPRQAEARARAPCPGHRRRR